MGNEEVMVVQSWKNYDIVKAIVNIKECIDEIKTIKSCWPKL